MARTHHLPDEQVHFTWDAGNEPGLTIDSGDTVVVWTRDVSDNQIGPGLGHERHRGLDWDRVYPLAGPIAVDGAEPGDTLAVEILDIHTQGWGWTAILPGLGLLRRRLHRAYLRIFDLSHGDVAYARGHRDPARRPSSGRWACARRAPSAQPVMPPGHVRRQHGHPPARRAARRSTCPSRSSSALFSSATRTAARATARSASPGSRRRCTRRCASR